MGSTFTLPPATQSGIADSVVAGGNVTAPAAGAAIATTAAVGAAGVYEVIVLASVGAGTLGAGDVGNLQLNKNAGAVVRLANAAPGGVVLGPLRITLAATDTLSVVAVGVGGTGVVYSVTIIARRIG